jgi:hypothetical protein
MQKFLSIPITATGETRQLLAADGVVIVEQTAATTVTVAYNFTTGTTPAVATITHTEMAANDVTVRDRIQDSIIAALQTSWTNPKYDVSLGGLESLAGGAVTITGIVLA